MTERPFIYEEEDSSTTNESIEIGQLQERAQKLSEQIKELNLTSDEEEENEEGTIIEKLPEEEVNVSVGESLEEVNSILTGIDQELRMNELNMENVHSKEGDSDSLKDEKSKKTISFSVPEKNKSPSSDDDEAEMDDIHSISSEASLTDNIPNLVTNEHNNDEEEQQRKIDIKSKKIMENYGKIPKQKYFDDRDGRKSNEMKSKKIRRFSREDTLKYIKSARPEFSKGRYFWQMPFREKLFHETMNPSKPPASSDSEEDEDTENQCVVPPDQDELDPRMFAPTGDIYSYFQKRRYQPFSSPGPMMYSTRTALGGRILKSHVY